MDSILRYVGLGVATFLAGMLIDHVKPKAKVVCWTLHSFLFKVEEEGAKNPVAIQTDSVTIQNFGRKAAEQVEIIYKEKPDHFELFPPVSYEEQTTSTGEYVLRVSTLMTSQEVINTPRVGRPNQ